MTTDPEANPHINLAAALITNDGGETLLVRKRGTVFFMQAGGKVEPHEKPVDALVRELKEELGLTITPTEPKYIGKFEAEAANEGGHNVVAEIFHLHVSGSVEANAEIEELVWVDVQKPSTLILTPLTRDHILPMASDYA